MRRVLSIALGSVLLLAVGAAGAATFGTVYLLSAAEKAGERNR